LLLTAPGQTNNNICGIVALQVRDLSRETNPAQLDGDNDPTRLCAACLSSGTVAE
jgi:hypothetical protein